MKVQLPVPPEHFDAASSAVDRYGGTEGVSPPPELQLH
jgi:hypothetical protein